MDSRQDISNIVNEIYSTEKKFIDSIKKMCDLIDNDIGLKGENNASLLSQSDRQELRQYVDEYKKLTQSPLTVYSGAEDKNNNKLDEKINLLKKTFTNKEYVNSLMSNLQAVIEIQAKFDNFIDGLKKTNPTWLALINSNLTKVPENKMEAGREKDVLARTEEEKSFTNLVVGAARSKGESLSSISVLPVQRGPRIQLLLNDLKKAAKKGEHDQEVYDFSKAGSRMIKNNLKEFNMKTRVIDFNSYLSNIVSTVENIKTKDPKEDVALQKAITSIKNIALVDGSDESLSKALKSIAASISHLKDKNQKIIIETITDSNFCPGYDKAERKVKFSQIQLVARMHSVEERGKAYNDKKYSPKNHEPAPPELLQEVRKKMDESKEKQKQDKQSDKSYSLKS